CAPGCRARQRSAARRRRGNVDRAHEPGSRGSVVSGTRTRSTSSEYNRDTILAEIRRTAAENAGKPLGMARFRDETGIRPEDWEGRYWARWSDAIREAGL